MNPPPLIPQAAPLESVAPPCPKCKVPLVGIEDNGTGWCVACVTSWDYVLFPACRRSVPIMRAVRAGAGEATCHYHAQNQAVVVCDDCGRPLCEVCDVPGENGRRLCPPCLSAMRKATPRLADEIVTHDTIALALAVLPLVVWPLTLLTAPAAIYCVILGWGKPLSLVRTGRARLVIAAVIAGLQIAIWAGFGVMAWAG